MNLVYRLLSVWQFPSVTSADAQKLLMLGLSCMNAAFSMICSVYGSTPSTTSSSNVSTPHGPVPSAPAMPGQSPAVGGQGVSATTTLSGSPSQSDAEYQAALVIVAEAIWVQKRVIRILMDDPASPQTVCFDLFKIKRLFLSLM